MKSTDDRRILHVIIATGISSVVTQLLTIREFLVQFQGNEIVIALILFNWLVLGGLGTLLARLATRSRAQATPRRLGWLSMVLAVLPVFQIFAIRGLRDVFFIHGASVGFYPTLAYTFGIIAPYCLLVGFVLPYSLFALRTIAPDYPGARVYIADNLGDVAGGAIFSFVLVLLVTPLPAVAIANLPLIITAGRLFRRRPIERPILAAGALSMLVLAAGLFLERLSLAPREGSLVYYRESRYGRIQVHRDREQVTLFGDGMPLFSNQNLSLAEESVHYALAQSSNPNRILVISAQGGMLKEIEKYHPRRVDYVELNPDVTDVLFKFDLIRPIEGLRLIHEDGRAFLSQTDSTYDAIIVNLPEPETFQVNRFYTDRFFSLAKERLSQGGVLSFSMQGFDNYLSDPQRRKLSSLFNTVGSHFTHVALVPGQRVFFLCSDYPLRTDMARLMADRNIQTDYIRGYYDGNITPARVIALKRLMDPAVPRNTDDAPYLMRLMFTQWFAKFATSPVAFIIALSGVCLFYIFRMSREEFVLFTTGGVTMGSEILVIFAYQIYYGYIYSQIGLIVTVFLAGLLPGAWYGERLQRWGHRVLVATDVFLILLLAGFLGALATAGDRLPVAFLLLFGFLVSLVCGCQFPVALHLRGGDNPAATRTFSADLMGAALGTLFTSTVLIPYLGIIWATLGLVAVKLISLITIGSARLQKNHLWTRTGKLP